MRTRVKICGITRRRDLEAAAEAGADAVGLVFASASPRRLETVAARALALAAPPLVHRVGLFMDQDEDTVRGVLDEVPLDVIQFHGHEAPEFCAAFGLPWFKTVAMADRTREDAAREAARYREADAILFDGHAAGEPGGSGRRLDPAALPETDRPVILAGGLTAEDVAPLVRALRPWAVDVSSGVESAPGEKDADSIRRFIMEVSRASTES